jgi:hypothetical protein
VTNLSLPNARVRHFMAATAAGFALCSAAAMAADVSAQPDILKPVPATKVSANYYQRNALLRCGVHAGDDRIACEMRMRGEGHTEGSVAGGGILRESVMVVPNK